MDAYVSGRQATIITSSTTYSILRACLLGEVRWRAMRGENMEFCRADLERWAAGRAVTV